MRARSEIRPHRAKCAISASQRLYRAYLLKEQLRAVFHADSPEQAIAILDGWLRWASRSKLPSFTKLARTIRAKSIPNKTRVPATA